MSDSMGKDIVVGLIVAAVLGVSGVAYGANIVQARQYMNADCDRAKGLRPIPQNQLVAQGTGVAHYDPDMAIDGYGGSQWSPPTSSIKAPDHKGISKFVPVFPNDQTSVLMIQFADPKRSQDIQLICVNNGLGNGDERYENWGKAKTIIVWPDDKKNFVKTAVLQAIPVEQSEDQQEVARKLGTVHSVHLQIVDAYAGKDVISYDPDRCQKVRGKNEHFKSIGENQETFTRGCILSATPRAGLGLC